MRVIVIGGGILGLATARELAAQRADAEVIVLEKEPRVAHHQTSHNSGVVHAGIYYAPGSLKARLCRRGLGLLREYCAARGLPYEQCGKVVVATEERELGRLRALSERAAANGVPGLRWLDGDQLRGVEPHARGLAALHSPETAIADFAAVAEALATDVRAAGGEVRTGTAVARVARERGRPAVALSGRGVLAADRVVVCAGLQSDRLARASGEPAEPRIVPFRGEYWQLRRERTHLVRGLIYPVPDPALPFLGVHLTRKIDGGVWLGPNAVLALALEGYERRRVNRRDLYETLSWPGTVRMLRRHWRAGVAEVSRSLRKRQFIRDIQRYVPSVAPEDAIPAPAGVRAQAVDRDGSLVDDFRLGVADGVVWVRNAPSPAATSSLAIAEELAELALGRRQAVT
ncbi:MAG: L-2-hydroxyglutarate oxidase [Solirubrobacterales bacterium]|nr:L-2-hydroxyglutarate oxidase [Solirubrobacterales bacterium]MBV9714407.1 L-2-hydroxyglutarate oxidase [Solirubrobacterales bacterium]